MIRQAIVLLAATTVAAGTPTTARAQPAPEPSATSIVLRPAAEPRPALRYRLVPERVRLVPGNAAIFYHRAVQMVIETRRRLDSRAKNRPDTAVGAGSVDVQVARWSSGALGEIPRDEAAALLASFQGALKEVELGALRATCDWEFDHRSEGINLLIPEIHEMRPLARLVALRARLAILEGKTDEAMHWVEVGYTMARHVSEGPTVIQGLVGVAIANSVITRCCLTELIQSPGTPSLYWALADRPRPLIDLRYPLEGERYLLEKELPELRELDRGPWSVDQARRFADELQRKLFALAAGEPIPGGEGTIPADLPVAVRRLGVAAMAAKVYPAARRALIAGGRPEAVVDAMPIVQAATLYSYLEYQQLRDDTYKWMNVPYWQSYDRIDRSSNDTAEAKRANPLLAMFRILTPALGALRFAALTAERRLDALQCVEALRLHAAAHEGKLPLRLEDIKEAPAPLDPATGKLFYYDAATLSAPVPPGGFDHPSNRILYTLKLHH